MGTRSIFYQKSIHENELRILGTIGELQRGILATVKRILMYINSSSLLRGEAHLGAFSLYEAVSKFKITILHIFIALKLF